MDNAHYTTIGMDVSDRKTQVCVMAKDGKSPKIVMETVVPTTKEGLAKFLSTQDRSTPVAFETGMHCRWMNEVAEGLGFKVYVANPCRLRMITESKTKNDVNDARMLARLALSDPGLLHPVKLRGPEHQRMLNLHEMRNLLVKQRTGIVVQLRAQRVVLGKASRPDRRIGLESRRFTGGGRATSRRHPVRHPSSYSLLRYTVSGS